MQEDSPYVIQVHFDVDLRDHGEFGSLAHHLWGRPPAKSLLGEPLFHHEGRPVFVFCMDGLISTVHDQWAIFGPYPNFGEAIAAFERIRSKVKVVGFRAKYAGFFEKMGMFSFNDYARYLNQAFPQFPQSDG